MANGHARIPNVFLFEHFQKRTLMTFVTIYLLYLKQRLYFKIDDFFKYQHPPPPPFLIENRVGSHKTNKFCWRKKKKKIWNAFQGTKQMFIGLNSRNDTCAYMRWRQLNSTHMSRHDIILENMVCIQFHTLTGKNEKIYSHIISIHNRSRYTLVHGISQHSVSTLCICVIWINLW